MVKVSFLTKFDLKQLEFILLEFKKKKTNLKVRFLKLPKLIAR